MITENIALTPTFTLNCRGSLYIIDRPNIMGIININDDSFYAGSRFTATDAILQQAEKMLEEGADIIDIGGQSTRPKAKLINAEEEKQRILLAIGQLTMRFPQLMLSVDTFYAEVAKEAVAAGASMINDISAGEMDDQMIPEMGKLNVPYIAMHMQGRPENMQNNPHYENVVEEVLDYFIRKTAACKRAGIKDVIIDPGFGFGKNLDHNYQLLKKLPIFKIFNLPLLVGLSRKSLAGRLLNIKAAEALNATTVLHTLALQQGANILRVHDVKEAKEVVRILKFYDEQ